MYYLILFFILFLKICKWEEEEEKGPALSISTSASPIVVITRITNTTATNYHI